MTRRPSKGDDHGFALIEALASLVVVAMIGLMLMAGLGAGRRVWERADAAATGGEAVDAAQSLLRDRLEQVFPATLYDRNPPYVDFEGSATAATFLSSPPAVDRPAPLNRYRLSLSPQGELLLASMSDVAQTDRGQATVQTLLAGVRRLELAYFGPAAPDGRPGWRPEWTEESAPPELVRIRLTFAPGDRRTWPDLIVRPRATVDSDCLLDPTTHGCKGRA